MEVLPKHIYRKLCSIYSHQHAVKRIINEVMRWANLTYDDTDKVDKWDWGMHIDLQGAIMHPEKMAALLQEFMENKIKLKI